MDLNIQSCVEKCAEKGASMQFDEFKTYVISEAEAAGITEYELYYRSMSEVTIVAHQRETDRFSSVENGGVCLRCQVDGNMGYASTECLTAAEAKLLVQKAVDNAAAIESEEKEELHKLGDTYLNARKKAADLPKPAQLIEKVLHAQEAALAADNRVTEGTITEASVTMVSEAISNSKGLSLSDSYTYVYLAVYPVIAEGEKMYSSDELQLANWSDIDAKEVAEKAVAAGIERIGAESIKSGTYSVLFSGKITALLLNSFSPIFSAENAQKGLSLLAGKEGEQIAAKIVTLTDDPFYEDSWVTCSFDAEGAASKTKHVIEHGEFKTLLHNQKTAKNAGIPTTGNAFRLSYSSPLSVMPFNFFLQPGTSTLDQLFEKLNNGLYITELSGLHAGTNAVTGDFSISAEGFLIEGGIKKKAVNNITVSGNFYTLLKNISDIGNELEFLPPAGRSVFGSPAVLVTELAIAGK